MHNCSNLLQATLTLPQLLSSPLATIVCAAPTQPSDIPTDIYSLAVKTQLYSIPPWAAAFGFSMVVAFFSDRLRHRFAFTLIPIAIAITGFAMLLGIHNKFHVEYGALFLVTCGAYSAMPVIVCWFAMNLGGHHRRSVGTAWQVGFGNIGGIISTFAFNTDKGTFTTGYSVCVAFCGLSVIACCIYYVALVLDNRKKDAIAANQDPNAISETEEELMGDLAPNYRYNY